MKISSTGFVGVAALLSFSSLCLEAQQVTLTAPATVAAGDSYTVTRSATGGTPPFSISLYKNGQYVGNAWFFSSPYVPYSISTVDLAAGAINYLAYAVQDFMVVSSATKIVQVTAAGPSAPPPAPAVSLVSPTTGAIASRESFTLALRADGTVWSWGGNNNGQLGDGTPSNRYTPRQVIGLGGIVSISAGGNHAVALTTNGNIWTWGSNAAGQLGNSTAASRALPEQVAGMSCVISIATGSAHTVVLRSDGKVWTWGLNASGQLGDASTNSGTFPREVPGLTNIIAVAAGGSHSLALRNDGTVWTWGGNTFGQLGNGSFTDSAIAIQVPGLANVTAIAAGDYSSFAIKADGALWAWGDNEFGQLGIGGAIAQISAATRVEGLESVVQVNSGNHHSVAVTSSGSIWSWGANEFGQLGLPADRQETSIPIQVNAEGPAVAASAGNNFTSVLMSDGSIWSAGLNDVGQLGDQVALARSRPTQLRTVNNVSALALGNYFALAAKTDGSLLAWGSNTVGQLGDETPSTRRSPSGVAGIYGAVGVAAGSGGHTALITNAGRLNSSGYNAFGELGNGTLTGQTSFLQVAGLVDVEAVAAGDYHTVALTGDGHVWTWGYNSVGSLGDGTTTLRSSPVLLSGLSNIQAIAAGGYNTVAIDQSGVPYGWGRGGSVGDGTSLQRNTPTPLLGLNSVKSAAVGEDFVLALRTDGTVWSWGGDHYGQLGDGTFDSPRLAPAQIPSLSNVVTIAAGAYHGLAVKADGSLWTWGYNFYGGLGDGTTIDRLVPTQVSGISNVDRVYGGFGFTIATTHSGGVWAWGNNTDGQLGYVLPDRTQVPIRLQTTADDVDHDGMDDGWEIEHFGNLSHAGYDDGDGDGLSDIQEFALGCDPTVQNTDGDLWTDLADPYPTDYYNKQAPTLAKLSGDNQSSAVNQFNAQPFDLAVFDAAGTTPLVNAPVTFAVTQGGGLLATAKTGNPPLTSTVNVRTDQDGTVQVYYQHPATAGVTSQITATAGTAQVVFRTESASNSQPTTVTLSGLSYAYDGSPHGATVTTSPAGLAVSVTYNGSSTVPVSAGSYAVTATVTESGYQGSASGTLTIARATPSVSWSQPAPIVYGTALSSTQLNASASIAGSFSYTPAAGAVLNAGTQTLNVSFSPSDSSNYTTASGSTSLVVQKATPTLTWTAPATIVYGTPLSGAQLNATASVNGTLSYGPAAGAILNAGSQTLGVTFTPADATNYTTTTKNVSLTVSKAPAQITFGDLTVSFDGTPKAATATTTPTGLTVGFTYNGDTNPPTTAGTYTVVATVTNPNYQGTATGTLTISPPLPAGYQLVLALPANAYLGVKPDLTVETINAP